MAGGKLVVFLFSVSLLGLASSQCPDHGLVWAYNPYSGTCFYLVPSKFNWHAALGYCTGNLGMQFARLDTVQSMAWFSNLRHTDPYWRDIGAVWIGGKRLKDELGWFWYTLTSKSPMWVADWEQHAPTGKFDKEYCLLAYSDRRFNKKGLQNFKWNDWRCNSQYSFVCERLSVA